MRLPCVFMIVMLAAGRPAAASALVQAATQAQAPVQAPFQARALAEYRLTLATFRQFEQASRAMAAAMRDDPKFITAPLFTHEVAVSGDAPVVAAELDARLQQEPALAGAIRGAKLTTRGYTTFALALFAARLAHGFVAAGVLRRVPAGVATDNVKFVDAHQAEIAAVLLELGVEG